MPIYESKFQLAVQELIKIGFAEARYCPVSGKITLQPDNELIPSIDRHGIYSRVEFNWFVESTLIPLLDKVDAVFAGTESPAGGDALSEPR